MLEFDFGTAVDEKTADVRERASALALPDRVSITPLKGLESIMSIDDLKSFALGNGVTVGDVAVIEERTAQMVIKKEDGLYALTLTAEVYGLDSGSAGNMLMDAALQVLDKEDGDTMAELNIKKCLSKYKVYGIIRL